MFSTFPIIIRHLTNFNNQFLLHQSRTRLFERFSQEVASISQVWAWERFVLSGIISSSGSFILVGQWKKSSWLTFELTFVLFKNETTVLACTWKLDISMLLVKRPFFNNLNLNLTTVSSTFLDLKKKSPQNLPVRVTLLPPRINQLPGDKKSVYSFLMDQNSPRIPRSKPPPIIDKSQALFS